MTKQEFILKSVGVPWIRWGSSWQGMDCYGLVVRYYKDVLNIDLPDVPQTELAIGFESMGDVWEYCEDPQDGIGFMSYRGDVPTHCGVYVGDGWLLHSHGNTYTGGSVRMTRLDAMERVFGKIAFYRMKQC
jgi:cell wall-associated NlpC family hydrolase